MGKMSVSFNPVLRKPLTVFFLGDFQLQGGGLFQESHPMIIRRGGITCNN